MNTRLNLLTLALIIALFAVGQTVKAQINGPAPELVYTASKIQFVASPSPHWLWVTGANNGTYHFTETVIHTTKEPTVECTPSGEWIIRFIK